MMQKDGKMLEGTPSRTALRVAMRRAAHQIFDSAPLVLNDPLAMRILGKEYEDEVRRTPDSIRKPFSAAIRAFMVVRSRFAEDLLASAYTRGVRQYVLLGAGLDTFAYRNPHQGLKVFEVDFPATQLWKRGMLREAGIDIPSSTHYAAVDFETHSLADGLEEAGFDFTKPAFFGWLGVVPYLTLKSFRETLQFIADRASGSGLIFDYGQPPSVLSPVERWMAESLASRVAKAGEPFQLYFTPDQAAEELTQFGFTAIEDLDGRTLTERYLARRNDGLALKGKSGRMVSAWKY